MKISGLVSRIQRANRDLPRSLIVSYINNVYQSVAGGRTVYNRVMSESTDSGDPAITPDAREYDVSTIAGLEDVFWIDRVYSGSKSKVVDVRAYGSTIFFDEAQVGNEYNIVAYKSGDEILTENDDIAIPQNQIENFVQGVYFLIEVDQHGSYQNWSYWNERTRKKIYYSMNKQAYKNSRIGGDEATNYTPY